LLDDTLATLYDASEWTVSPTLYLECHVGNDPGENRGTESNSYWRDVRHAFAGS
jgi:hypothetical protein